MKVFSIKMERILLFIYCAVLVIGIATSIGREAIPTFNMPISKKVVVIDAGHGGWDPGKVGDSDVLEKNINLAVALKLQSYLEQGGSVVLMTRIEDEALGTKKTADMQNRKELTNLSKADIIISIHQNSYPSQNVKGAQTFYYSQSEKSMLLAQSIQTELISFLDPQNKREIKPNNDYYILKQTDIPAVIVECGFLSSDIEMKLLSSDEYQEKIAWSIYMGIIKYFEPDENPSMADQSKITVNLERILSLK